jgi:hypothetical protein
MSIHHSVVSCVLAVTSVVSAGCGIAPDRAEVSETGEVPTAAAAPAAKSRQVEAAATARSAARSGEDDDTDSSGIGFALRPAVHAEFNAFACEAPDHAVFAGRYTRIEVFADMASLGPDHHRAAAKVFGHVSVGLPDLLSDVYIKWDLAWLKADDTVLLYGTALTPIGDTIVARMTLARDPGLHPTTINATNMTTGATISDAVNCTVR